jgi:hypothetical protein
MTFGRVVLGVVLLCFLLATFTAFWLIEQSSSPAKTNTLSSDDKAGGDDDDDDGSRTTLENGVTIQNAPLFFAAATDEDTRHAGLLQRRARLRLLDQLFASVVVGEPGRILKLRVDFSSDVSRLPTFIKVESRSYAPAFSSDVFYLGGYKLRLPVRLRDSLGSFDEWRHHKEVAKKDDKVESEESIAEWALRKAYEDCDGTLALGPRSRVWRYWSGFRLDSDSLELLSTPMEKKEMDDDDDDNDNGVCVPLKHRRVSSEFMLDRGVTALQTHYRRVAIDLDEVGVWLPNALLAKQSFHFLFGGAHSCKHNGHTPSKKEVSLRYSRREQQLEIMDDLSSTFVFSSAESERHRHHEIVLGRRALHKAAIHVDLLQKTMQLEKGHRMFIGSSENYALAVVATLLMVVSWLLDAAVEHLGTAKTQDAEKTSRAYGLILAVYAVGSLFCLVETVVLVDGFNVTSHVAVFTQTRFAWVIAPSVVVSVLMATGSVGAFVALFAREYFFSTGGGGGENKIQVLARWQASSALRHAAFDRACLLTAWLALIRRHDTIVDAAFIAFVGLVLACDQTFWCAWSWIEMRRTRFTLLFAAVAGIVFFFWWNVLPCEYMQERLDSDFNGVHFFVVFSVIVAVTVFAVVAQASSQFAEQMRQGEKNK